MVNDQNWNGLHYAASSYKNNSEIIELLLDLGVDIDAQNKEGKTPLHMASERAQIVNVKKLLDRGSNVHLLDNENSTALHRAAWSYDDRSEIFELLLGGGVDVDAQNSDGQTALQIACTSDTIINVKKLIDCGANIHLRDNRNDNALHYAIGPDTDCPEIIQLLLDGGLDVDVRTNEGETPLHLACYWSSAKCLKKLLDRGANVHLVDNKNLNALHHASLSTVYYEEMTDLLLNSGVDVDVQCNEGKTSLHLACERNHIENVENLLCFGSNVHLVDNNNRNALHYAVQSKKNNSEIIGLLLDNGVDVDVRDKEGRTALQLACKQGQMENVKKLLDRGSNVHLVDYRSWNALHYAAHSDKNNSEIIELLLDLGVDIDAQNTEGRTALQLAYEWDGRENIEKLIDRGSNFLLVDYENSNMLHYAAQSHTNNSEIIELPLDSGEDMNAQNKKDQTALQLACKSAQIENIKQLLDRGSNLRLVDYENSNALHYAAQSDHNNSEIIELLLDLGVDIDAQNNEGRTALQFACGRNQIENVKKLINRGSNVHLVDNKNWNALHYAAFSSMNNSEIIGLLLDGSVDVNVRNKISETALQLACEGAQTENVKKLLDRGSNVHMVDNNNWNALHHAAFSDKDNSEIIGLLLDSGVDVDVRGKEGQTALQLACKWVRVENVKKLLHRGSNVHLVDDKNCNAMHHAAFSDKNNSEIIELLLHNVSTWMSEVRKDEQNCNSHIE